MCLRELPHVKKCPPINVKHLKKKCQRLLFLVALNKCMCVCVVGRNYLKRLKFWFMKPFSANRIIISVYLSSSKFTHDLNGMDFLLSRTFPDSCIDFLRLLSLNQRLLCWSLHPPHHHRVSRASRTLNSDNLRRGDIGHLHCLHHGIH